MYLTDHIVSHQVIIRLWLLEKSLQATRRYILPITGERIKRRRSAKGKQLRQAVLIAPKAHIHILLHIIVNFMHPPCKRRLGNTGKSRGRFSLARSKQNLHSVKIMFKL